jgi:hypothetical protein
MSNNNNKVIIASLFELHPYAQGDRMIYLQQQTILLEFDKTGRLGFYAGVAYRQFHEGEIALRIAGGGSNKASLVLSHAHGNGGNDRAAGIEDGASDDSGDLLRIGSGHEENRKQTHQ